MPRIHFLQHVDFETPGYLGSWANENHYPVSFTKFFEPYVLPDVSEYDWLIIMGGPMSVYDDAQYPWLKTEKQFIKSAIEEGKTVIGICLGCQLIALALGAKVYPNTKKEIGWFPVSLTHSAANSEVMKGLPDHLMTFHWHGDTFDLPAHAVHLMQTPVCKIQAFLYKNNVMGLQFHLEAQLENVVNMIRNCREELVTGDYIQTEDFMMKNLHHIESANTWLKKILDHLLISTSHKADFA
jgi:GMP synthase-like glutamine amidotransferase